MRIGKAIPEGQTITVKKLGTNSDIINALHKYMPYAVEQSKKRASLFKGKDNLMFTGSILDCLGIPYKFAYTSYTDSKTPQHVYVQTDDGVIIDAVWDKFNDEKIYTYKYLKK